MGYGNKFWWLATTNVTFSLEGYPDFEPYPASAKASRFCLFAKAQPAKVRLRKPLCGFLRSE